MLNSKNKVTLIASDSTEFIIDYEIAIVSKTLQIFLDTNMPFKESRTRIIKLPIKSNYLKRIIEFMMYKFKNSECLLINEFKISESESLELLNVAAYMDL